MKKSLLIIILSFSVFTVFATHIIGGEMRYEYIGPGSSPNSKQYRIRLLLLKGDAGGADLINQYVVGVFNNDNGQKIPGSANNSNWLAIEDFSGKLPVPITVSPCITGDTTLLYTYKTYSFTIELPNNNLGYTVAFQTFSRQNSFNIVTNQGATYSCIVPGLSTLPLPLTDNCPKYKLPISVICANSPFNLDFSATDADGDSLVYTFCNAYNGGAADAGDFQNPVGPPYGSVNYAPPYTGSSPMGSQVTINPRTGIISGIAPSSGKYVLCVCVSEYKNRQYIGTHRKDLIVAVNTCTPLAANPTFAPINCESLTVTFTEASSGNPSIYSWDFGDPASGAANTSNAQTPTHTFTAAGIYNVKLSITGSANCVDSVTKQLKLFPGFNPDFTVTGQCKNTPIQFNDISTATYGTINNWSWNFGEIGSGTNTSTIRNPTHTYVSSNSYNVQLIVSSSVGCIDTVLKTILITDKPALAVPNDTLICIIDTLQLNAIGTGSFVWNPNYNISNINISNPLVSPDVTTTYHVTLTDPYGCVGSDSVKVSVVSQVTQFAPNDTTICKTDAIVLRLLSDALHYQWTEFPAGNTLNNPNIKNPTATPLTNTTYSVIGSIGKCVAQSTIRVKVVPYPNADAGVDQTICFGKSAQLIASGGSSYSWSPAAFLNNRLIYNPVSVNPTANIKYTVTVTDTLGCPKPVKDTVVVFVARIKADAGPRDTSVVLNQPLLLQATGSTHYLWSPAQWLTNIGISNPVSLPQADIEYIVKVSNDAGCFDYDSIRVHLFKLDAGIYVPSGFTPNGDGSNDYFRPIIIGMKSLDLFRVYNRWGQLMYSGSDAQKGWDGTYGGKGQDPATYVWYAEGTDYKGTKIKKKGYVVLIR
ncbi:PKD domain-containing protein [Ferruginibacter sp. SUN106]|uniref:PKD domain-containing protein n=1 Tax=Ferruginibacter sp. SUN106 TaxID=2978348 RepID=UPI003D36D780